MATRPLNVGLARVTVAAPRRRLDIALPEQVPIADLLPSLLRHAGEALAEDGERHGGWILRRSDGQPLDTARALAVQQVRDGEILHLVPYRLEWPEPDYDDIAEAIASGSRRHAPPWDGRTTLAFGITAVGVLLAVGLYPVLWYGHPWLLPGLFALGVAVVLAGLGVVLARAMADAGSGALLAAYSLPYAFAGGLVIFSADRPTPGLGAAEILGGSAALLLFSVLGYFGVSSRGRLFVAGALAGLFGVVAGLLAQRVSAAGVAGIAAVVLVAAAVGFPLLSMRLGKLPLPAVPQTAADLMNNQIPDRANVFAAVARADELLTGLLIGTAVVQAVSAVVLVDRGGVSGLLLVGIVGLLNLLRARQYVTVRHRLPLLIAGLVGLIAVAVGRLADLSPGQRLVFASIGVLVLGGLILAAAVAYSRRAPTPYLGRAAEILDVLLLVAVVPIACAVLGLFDFVRGFGG